MTSWLASIFGRASKKKIVTPPKTEPKVNKMATKDCYVYNSLEGTLYYNPGFPYATYGAKEVNVTPGGLLEITDDATNIRTYYSPISQWEYTAVPGADTEGIGAIAIVPVGASGVLTPGAGNGAKYVQLYIAQPGLGPTLFAFNGVDDFSGIGGWYQITMGDSLYLFSQLVVVSATVSPRI